MKQLFWAGVRVFSLHIDLNNEKINELVLFLG